MKKSLGYLFAAALIVLLRALFFPFLSLRPDFARAEEVIWAVGSFIARQEALFVR